MKKLFILSILISSIAFAEKIYTENDIFIKEGKAYTLLDEKAITGMVSKKLDNQTIYSTYENGVKTKEKILDSNRNVVSDYYIDNLGLLNGVSYIELENGETIKANYKKGIVNGFAEQTYYEEFDFAGNFSYGIAHGKVEAIDIDGSIKVYNYSQGIQKNKMDSPLFEEYFNKAFVNKDTLQITGETAKSGGKLFSGMAFKAYDGYISDATYYLNGERKADFYFAQGFMYSAKVYKNKNSFEEYTFYEEMNKGVINSHYNYENSRLNGNYKFYFINGDRQEGIYKDEQLLGKVTTYNISNNIVDITEYTKDSYKKTSYYDYAKGKIKLTSQGIFNKDTMEWTRVGKEIRYYEDGKIEREVTFSKEEANAIIYYSSGKSKLIGKVNPYTDLFEGVVTEYYESGKVKAKYNYAEGYLDGIQTYYDENGKVIKTEEYDYGYILD